jgi:hypothetical protein
MKECPQCNSVYSDDTLRFCLTDGTELVDRGEGAPTVEMSGLETAASEETRQTEDSARVRIDVPRDEEVRTVSSAKIPVREEKKGFSGGLVAALVGLLIIVIAVLAVSVGYILFQQDRTVARQEPGSNVNSRGAEVERLKHRIDELGNRLSSNLNDDAKSSPEPVKTATPKEDEPEFDDEVIKRVNSPADGFLALRDTPFSRKGSRLAKIPHGDIVVLGKCQKNAITIGGRTGHWCRAKWEGYSGWVFDVWLTD